MVLKIRKSLLGVRIFWFLPLVTTNIIKGKRLYYRRKFSLYKFYINFNNSTTRLITYTLLSSVLYKVFDIKTRVAVSGIWDLGKSVGYKWTKSVLQSYFFIKYFTKYDLKWGKDFLPSHLNRKYHFIKMDFSKVTVKTSIYFSNHLLRNLINGKTLECHKTTFFVTNLNISSPKTISTFCRWILSGYRI